MAPKGGGGRGGGSSRGSSGGSGSDYSDSIQLPGTRFSQPSLIATTVILIICWLALLFLIRWSRSYKKQFLTSRKPFGRDQLGTAMSTTAIMWGLTIFDVFMRQFNANVTKLYVIVGVLILAFGILSVIYTIGAILSILTSELEFANQDIARRTKLINTASLTVITLIGAATLALGITVAVNAANSSNVFLYSSSYYSRSGIRHAYEALNSTFSILQFVISIVIIGVAIMWLNKAPKPGATHKSAVYMLGLVATPFFVFSFVLMILVIHFELQKYSGDAEAVAIVVAIFSYIPVAVLFLGLSLVSRLDPNSQVKPATGITPIVGPNVHEAPNNRISHPPQHLAPPPNGNTTWQPYNPSVSPASTQSYGPTYPVQQVQPQTWGQTMSPPPQAPQQQAWGHSSSPPPQQPHYGQQQAYQQPYNPQAAAPMPNPLVQYR